jgi:hypothetical protein
VAALVRSVERLSRQVVALDGRVRQLADDLTLLATVVGETNRAARGTPTAPPATGRTGVRSWLRLDDPVAAITDLAELIAWLDEVYLRYPDALLSACWLWHPHVIEELWWLCQAHADAYHPETGTWLKVGDWHDRQRPLVATRIRAALAKCDLSLHTAPAQDPDRRAPLVGHAATVAEAWLKSRSRPVPTVEQLAEAKALHRPATRPRR